MKIVRCSKCGKYFYKVNKCFYCGDTSEINEVRESVNLNEKLNSGFGPNARVNSI